MRADIEQTLADALENRKKLNGCPRHQFEPTTDRRKLDQKHTCTCCGGQMRLNEIARYIEGYEAAGGSADHIWFGFRNKGA